MAEGGISESLLEVVELGLVSVCSYACPASFPARRFRSICRAVSRWSEARVATANTASRSPGALDPCRKTASSCTPEAAMMSRGRGTMP